MGKLSKAQVAFLRRLDGDDFGPARNMSPGQRRTGHSLKARGLVILDGAFVSSAITEGSSSFDGSTFVLTDAGRAALKSGAPDA